MYLSRFMYVTYLLTWNNWPCADKKIVCFFAASWIRSNQGPTKVSKFLSKPMLIPLHCGGQAIYHSKAITSCFQPCISFFFCCQRSTNVFTQFSNSNAIETTLTTTFPFMCLSCRTETVIFNNGPIIGACSCT